MTESISLLADERHANEFIADDWETTELPVPVTDQATAGWHCWLVQQCDCGLMF